MPQMFHQNADDELRSRLFAKLPTLPVSPQTLASAVVQVFTADRNSSWSKWCCGVACLVKDNPQRSYFIRVFDIKVGREQKHLMSSFKQNCHSVLLLTCFLVFPQEGKKMFEQELYNNFSIYLPKPYFITFAGDVSSLFLHFFIFMFPFYLIFPY